MVISILAGAVLAWTQAQYTQGGDPTPGEQYALEVINRARANPSAEGARLAIPGGIGEGLTASEVTDIGPRPPLAMNATLLQIARAHSQDMWTNDYFDHDAMPPGTSAPYWWPWDRANAAGYTGWSQFSENIATGSNHTPVMLEDILMRDLGPPPYPGRGHRKNLLDIDDASTVVMREIGVGYYSGTMSKTNILRDVLTEDFGRRDAVGPFIVGVVYDDTNANNFYDPGEELAGVTVRLNPPGSFFAVTATAGGYSFPYTGASGSITVEVTGGAFGAGVASKVVTRTGENVKVDFKLSDMTDSDGDGLDDAWETTNFGNLAQTAAGDPDGDTYNNLAEFNAGTDPMNAASVPPPPAPKKKGGGGGCGLSGLEALLVLGLLRLARR